MHRILPLLSLVICLFYSYPLYAEEIPADISFLVVDLKYNAKQGVKICEIQQASLSVFNGTKFVTGSSDSVGEGLYEVLSPFQNEVWMHRHLPTHNAYSRFGEKYGWTVHANAAHLTSDAEFRRRAELLPENPHSLSDYQGIAYFRCRSSKRSREFREKYPGILLVDGAAAGPCRNKETMSVLFNGDPALVHYRPKWKLYKTRYRNSLANRIKRDLSSEMFVIKPSNCFEGKGVIIVHGDDLDDTLRCILKESSRALKHPDPAYQFWGRRARKEFIVEAFIPSDPVIVPHLDDKLYDPTYRFVFLLYYHKKETHVAFLGNFAKFASKSLEEEGSLNERYKSCLRHPFYDRTDPEAEKIMERQLTDCLTRLYKKMLGFKSS